MAVITETTVVSTFMKNAVQRSCSCDGLLVEGDSPKTCILAKKNCFVEINQSFDICHLNTLPVR